MQPEFLLALLAACRTEGIHTAVDTTAYAEPQVMARVAPAADLFLCDLKHMNRRAHEQYTRVDNRLILDNLGTLAVIFSSTGTWSKWGSWGLLEYHGQPAADAPKYQAVIEFLDAHPKWW